MTTIFQDVFAPGAAVAIGGGEIMATVLTVSIRENGTQYEVSWWDGRQRLEAWVTAAEVAPIPNTPAACRVGFRVPPKGRG